MDDQVDPARQLPSDRLLLETDLPPGRDVKFSARQILDELENTLGTLKNIRGTDMRPAVTANSARVLGMPDANSCI